MKETIVEIDQMIWFSGVKMPDEIRKALQAFLTKLEEELEKRGDIDGKTSDNR